MTHITSSAETGQDPTGPARFGAQEKTLRCIVVGLGGVSRSMLRVLADERWYRTVALVDVEEQALLAAQETLGLGSDVLFADLTQALAAVDADVVLVNSPSEWHTAQTVTALEAGKDVLVAKPFTNDFQEAADLVELARSQGKSLCVAQQMRYNRHYTTVRNFLATRELGRAEMVNFLSAKPRHSALNLATTGPAGALRDVVSPF